MYSRNVNRTGFRRSPILAVEVSESPRPALPRRALLLAASRVCLDAPAMACELVLLQRRLGTRAERAADQDRINFLALQLSSLIYAAFLLDDEEREGGLADDSAPF
jgi:hypothetical protein